MEEHRCQEKLGSCWANWTAGGLLEWIFWLQIGQFQLPVVCIIVLWALLLMHVGARLPPLPGHPLLKPWRVSSPLRKPSSECVFTSLSIFYLSPSRSCSLLFFLAFPFLSLFFPLPHGFQMMALKSLLWSITYWIRTQYLFIALWQPDWFCNMNELSFRFLGLKDGMSWRKAASK